MPARRQRRGQVDADQDPLRASTSQTRARYLCDGRGGALHLPARCARARDRHGLPGPGDDPADVRSRATSSSAPEPTKGWGPFRRFDVETAERDHARRAASRWGSTSAIPSSAVGTLSGGERQSVAIARAVYFGARVLILDEPTAALGVKEAGVVLRYIAQARARGLGVIFITHNVHHAYPIGDRFTLLNRGRSYGTFEKADVTREQVVQMMAGGEELETLAHELQQVAGDDAELQKAVAVLEQEVKAWRPSRLPPSPRAEPPPTGRLHPRSDVDASGPYDLVTMGRVGVDLYPEQSGVPLAEVDTFAKSLGGSPTNVAVGAARYGHRVAVITKVGADGFGDYVHAALRGFGVDDRFVGTDAELRTPIVFCELLPPDSPTILFYRQPSAPTCSSRPKSWTSTRSARPGLLDDRDRSVRRAESVGDDRRARGAGALGHHRARPGLSPGVLVVARRGGRAAAAGPRPRHGRGGQRGGVPGGGGRRRRGDARRQLRPRRGPRDREAGGGGRPGAWAGPRNDSRPVAVRVVNGLGAGDAFGAAVCHGLLQGWDVPRTIRFANGAGAHVAATVSRAPTRCPTRRRWRRCSSMREPGSVPAAHAATARSSPGRSGRGRETAGCRGRTASPPRRTAPRDPLPRGAAAPRRPARQAGRRAEPLPEGVARRTSALGVVRELVEQRRFEVGGGARRPDEHQGPLGRVPRPVRQFPRDADRHAVQPARARGDRVREALAMPRRHGPEVVRRAVREPHTRSGGRRRRQP